MIGAVIAGLFLGLGFIFFIGGGATVGIAGSTKYLFLVGVGFGLFLTGMITFAVGCCVIQSKMVTRLQQAIAQESAKYSQRSPKPCSWRLDTTRTTAGYHDNRRTYVSYHVSSYRRLLRRLPVGSALILLDHHRHWQCGSFDVWRWRAAISDLRFELHSATFVRSSRRPILSTVRRATAELGWSILCIVWSSIQQILRMRT